MKKTFILDTNVLLHDPQAIFSFADNDVVIPIYVVEEIDHFKKELSELGRNARQAGRYLDKLRDDGSLSDGVKLDGGGILKVATTNLVLPNHLSSLKGQDSWILATALDFKEKLAGLSDVIFLTKDTNLRIRADAIGIFSENFDPEKTGVDDIYEGFNVLDVEGSVIDTFYKRGCVALPDPYFGPNEYLILKDKNNTSHSAIGRVDLLDKQMMPLRIKDHNAWGIKPRNKEQTFALDLLLDDSVSLVTLVGKAGTGKTLIAVAAGLQKVAEERAFQKLLISRPIFPLGRDIGYLPGDLEEKLNPWMQPIYDNVEYLMGITPRAGQKQTSSYKELIDMGLMQIEPLTYIRGRSIASQFMIVDEAQNLTPHEVKTIISRAGEGTKIVLTGDPYQIDNPYVDATNNGLIHVVNRLKGEKLVGHIKLSRGERSELAELAANML